MKNLYYFLLVLFGAFVVAACSKKAAYTTNNWTPLGNPCMTSALTYSSMSVPAIRIRHTDTSVTLPVTVYLTGTDSCGRYISLSTDTLPKGITVTSSPAGIPVVVGKTNYQAQFTFHVNTDSTGVFHITVRGEGMGTNSVTFNITVFP